MDGIPEDVFQHLMRWEGGWVNDPHDRGGATKYGISLRFLRSVMPGATADTVRQLTEDDARRLYRIHFWDEVRCSELPEGLDLAVFDCAVNQGVGRARRFLQQAARVKVDGVIGPVTIDAAHRPGVLLEFMVRRALHYSSLSQMARYGRGWFRRLFDTHAAAIGRTT